MFESSGITLLALLVKMKTVNEISVTDTRFLFLKVCLLQLIEEKHYEAGKGSGWLALFRAVSNKRLIKRFNFPSTEEAFPT